MGKEITLYAVRNSDKQWLRKIGYGGSGKSWTDEFNQARIYTKIGAARSMVSWWANNYPQYPTPELVQFQVSGVKVLDETARVEKQKLNKQKAEQRRELRDKQWKLEMAQRDLEDAQKRLSQYKHE